jgi:endo-1,3(4)-beta-glucanase
MTVFRLILLLAALLAVISAATSCAADWECGTSEYCTSTRSCGTNAGASVSDFYPFGTEKGDSKLRGDDAKAIISNNQNFPFAGTTYSTIFIGSNGLISFGNQGGVPFNNLDPRPLPIENSTFIAPLWMDYDNRQNLANGANSIYYRSSTDSSIKTRATDDVRKAFGLSDFNAEHVIIATWFKVGKWKRATDKLNTFQVVLVSDGVQSFAVLYYSHIGTRIAHGLFARAGFNSNSAKITSVAYELPASGTSTIDTSLETSSNVNFKGKWVYQITGEIRGATNSNTECSMDDDCSTDKWCDLTINGGKCVANEGMSLSDFYPFGKDQPDQALPQGDDSKDQLSSPTPFIFLGESFPYLFIGSNGLISFGKSASSTAFNSFTPKQLPVADEAFIAPYWTDTDTSVPLKNNGNNIYYRMSTNSAILNRFSSDIHTSMASTPGAADFNARAVAIVTWYRVGRYSNVVDKLSTWQAVIGTDGTTSYAIFNYGRLAWSYANLRFARIGFNNNDKFYELTQSGSEDASGLATSSNVDKRGQWVFKVDSLASTTPPVSPPTTTPVTPPVTPPTTPPVAPPVTPPVSPPTGPVTTARRSVGQPITTAAPFFPFLRNHPETPPAQLLGPMTMPYPTNAWHTNMYLNQGNMPMVTSPYVVQVRNTGIQISYTNRVFSAGGGYTVFINNLAVGPVETINQRRVMDWDIMSVTMLWSNNLPTTYNADTINYGTRANSMIAPFVQGSPYITTKWDGLTPRLTTSHALLNVNGGTAGQISGTKFKVTLNNGQTWLVYASNSITWNRNGNALTASGPYRGTIRVVVLTNDSFETVLDANSASVPIATKVGWTANGNDAVIQFDYITEDNSAPLIMTLPHHRDTMTGVNYVMQNAFITMKGRMSGIVAKSWKLNEKLTAISWGAPRPIPSQYTAAIRQALQQEQGMTQQAQDTYFGGKNLAAMGRLALIADELGETGIASGIRGRMKASLERWFTSQTPDRLIYDRTWGGVISSNGINDRGADFGYGWYNDVHFHLGYFVYAAAVVAKEDRAWSDQWAPAVNDLIRCFANPVHDANFPVTRMKDWYAGHSWASGLFEFGDAKNQESSSESVNGYYGMYLWGLVRNNANLRDLGRVMLAQEIRATNKYWHMDGRSNEVYDQVFADNGCVGILWGTKVDYATWFGNNVEFIIGIQMMPYTPISEEYMVPSWVQTVYPRLSTALTRTTPPLEVGWRGFIYMAQAVVDKAAAWNNVNSLNGWDNGNSKTNTLYWVATR